MSVQIQIQMQMQMQMQMKIEMQMKMKIEMQILYPSKDRDLGNKDAFFLPRSQSFCPAS